MNDVVLFSGGMDSLIAICQLSAINQQVAAMPRKLTTSEYNERLAPRGIFASEPYAGTGIKIRHECKCGYTWLTKPLTILKDGCGCPQCAGNVTSPEYIQRQYREHNIELLSEWAGWDTKNDLSCLDCGFEWQATGHSLRAGYGCPSCGTSATRSILGASTRFQTKASQLGFDVVGEYKSAHQPLKLRCRECQTVTTKLPTNVKAWTACRKCNSVENTSAAEKLIIDHAEQATGLKFHRHFRHSRMINPLTGRLLSFDGYNIYWKVAIEVQGPLHFRSGVGAYGATLQEVLAVQQRDRIKRKLAADLGILLLQVPHTSYLTASKLQLIDNRRAA